MKNVHCDCSGDLQFKKIEHNTQWFDFHFTCLTCNQVVIQAKIPTPQGYVTVHTTSLST